MVSVLDGYVRVSQVRDREGETFISPDVQRNQITRWADAHGHELGEVFIELDESGARADRPLLLRAIERVEIGDSEGLVVAKLDRFGRSLVHGLALLARIEEAGGTFASVGDGFDLATSTGRLMLRMMLAMGEWELERMRENWAVAKQRAVARGVHMAPVVPLGYRRAENGRLWVDPAESTIVAEVFRMRSHGVGRREVAAFLNRSDLRTHTGVPFTPDSVTRMTRKRAYRGESFSAPFSNPRAHEPIVDAETWEAAQNPLPEPTGDSALSRLLRCADCGRMLTAIRSQAQRSTTLVYRCSNPDCEEPASVRADEIEPLVEQRVTLADPTSEWIKRWTELDPTERWQFLVSRIDCIYLERGLEDVAGRAWIFDHGTAPMGGKPSYMCRPFCEVEAEAERLESLARWPEHRLASTLRWFFAPRPVWPSYEEFALAGCAQLHAQVMAWGGPYWWAPRLKVEVPEIAVQWNRARVEGALGPFLDGRESWPTLSDFVSADLERVHRAVHGHGGIGHWAAHFGFDWKSKRRIWTLDRIERELRAFTANRETYPVFTDFARAGKRTLCGAARQNGGVEFWAERLGLRITNGSRENDRERPGSRTGESVAHCSSAEPPFARTPPRPPPRGCPPGADPGRLGNPGPPRIPDWLLRQPDSRSPQTRIPERSEHLLLTYAAVQATVPAE